MRCRRLRAGALVCHSRHEERPTHPPMDGLPWWIMKLTDDDVENFNQAYSSDWGQRLTDAEARLMGQRLVHLYSLLSKLHTRESLAERETTGYADDDPSVR